MLEKSSCIQRAENGGSKMSLYFSVNSKDIFCFCILSRGLWKSNSSGFREFHEEGVAGGPRTPCKIPGEWGEIKHGEYRGYKTRKEAEEDR